jgi:hypothetical protein
MSDRVIWVEVDCYACLNANRYARRECTVCRRTGKVRKTVIESSQPEHDKDGQDGHQDHQELHRKES